jgi:hypothetical protein
LTFFHEVFPETGKLGVMTSVLGCHHLLLVILCSSVLGGCKLPSVNIATPEPIAVDIKMRVDVYQYDSADGGKKPDEDQQREYARVVERQRNRMQEIQNLKNNRILGEDHRGLLSIIKNPGGDWGDYVSETVKSENEDRLFLQRYDARQQDKLLTDLQKEDWIRRTDRAFPGEWIEVEGEREGTFRWTQAGGVNDADAVEAKPAEETKAPDAPETPEETPPSPDPVEPTLPDGETPKPVAPATNP